MSDNFSTENFWDTGATHFNANNSTMTMREASRIFRLAPEPPKADYPKKLLLPIVLDE